MTPAEALAKWLRAQWGPRLTAEIRKQYWESNAQIYRERARRERMGDAMTDDGTKLRQACIPCGVRLWADAEWDRIAAAARSLFGPAAEERAVLQAATSADLNEVWLALCRSKPWTMPEMDASRALFESLEALRASRKPKPPVKPYAVDAMYSGDRAHRTGPWNVLDSESGVFAQCLDYLTARIIADALNAAEEKK